MKRHVKMSLVLVALLLAFAFIFTGCNNAKVDEAATNAQNAADAANKAQSDLDSAKTELNKDIEEAAKKALSDLEAAKAALDKAIKDGDKADADALEAKAEELAAAIDAAEAAAEAADGALATELKAAIADAKTAVNDAALQLKAWNDATDLIISDAAEASLKALLEKYAEYEAVERYYFEADYAEIEYQYNAAYIRMMRASTTDAVKAAYSTFATEAAAVPTIPTSLYNALMAAGESVDDLVYDEDVKENIVKAKTVLGAVAAKELSLKTELMAQINAYGTPAQDLEALYNTYIARYGVLTMINGGEELLADIEEALEALVVPTSDFTAIRGAVTAWTTGTTNTINGAVTNDVAQVEGLADAIQALTNAEARAVALGTAYTEAEALNARIENLAAAIEADGATVTNEDLLDTLNEDVAEWITTYFSAPYADEKAEGGSVNYNKVNHAELEEVNELYLSKLDSFKAAAERFTKALEKVGEIEDINLLSADALDAAWDAYFAWVVEAELRNFDYASNPSADYLKLVQLDTAYKNLVAEALSEYNLKALPDNFVVTLYDGNKIIALLDWYEEYAVLDENGEDIVFGDGYVLSDTLTITESDLEELLDLYIDYEILKAYKVIETEEVEELIQKIGTVTMNDEADILAAKAAYDAWLSGANVTAIDGYTFTAAQFALDENNTLSFYVSDDVLTAARADWNVLNTKLTNIKNAINTLVAKKDIVDFNGMDATAVADYEGQVNAITRALGEFYTANGNSYENKISEAEFGKYYAAVFAIAKYEDCASILAAQTAANTAVDALEITAADKTTTKNAIEAIVADAKAAIEAVYVANDNADAATRKTEIDAITALAIAKIDAVKGAADTYEDYVKAVEDDTALATDEVAKANKLTGLNTSYIMSVYEIKNALTADSVTTVKNMVVSQLETVYPILP